MVATINVKGVDISESFTAFAHEIPEPSVFEKQINDKLANDYMLLSIAEREVLAAIAVDQFAYFEDGVSKRYVAVATINDKNMSAIVDSKTGRPAPEAFTEIFNNQLNPKE